MSDTVLRTARLDLRPLVAGDADRLFAIHSDPEVMRYGSTPAWTERAQAVDKIEAGHREVAAGTHVRLAIVLRDEARLVGTCDLFAIDRPCRRAEVGYAIDAAYWRRGLMAEAVSALIEHGFSALDLHRIEADIDPRNVASAAGLEKLGFVKEGHLRERWIVAGEVSDSVIYGLLRSDWIARAGGRGIAARRGS